MRVARFIAWIVIGGATVDVVIRRDNDSSGLLQLTVTESHLSWAANGTESRSAHAPYPGRGLKATVNRGNDSARIDLHASVGIRAYRLATRPQGFVYAPGTPVASWR